MDITVHLIGGLFTITAVRGTAVVMNAGVLRHYCRKNAFVDVSGGEVGLSEVARLIRVVEFKTQRLGKSVIYLIVRSLE